MCVPVSITLWVIIGEYKAPTDRSQGGIGGAMQGFVYMPPRVCMMRVLSREQGSTCEYDWLQISLAVACLPASNGILEKSTD